MSDVTPARIGLLIDYIDDEAASTRTSCRRCSSSPTSTSSEACSSGRSSSSSVRSGTAQRSFRAVRDAFFELVEEDALVIFGPWVSENGAALRRYVEELGEVACITMGATETMLGEWVFGLPAGSMEEEPIIMATVAALDGCRTSASRSRTR